MNTKLMTRLDAKIHDLQAIALNQIKSKADRVASLDELRTAIYDYTRTMNNAIIEACDAAAAEREAAPAPMLAILRDRHGDERGRFTLADVDSLDCDHYAARFAELLGFELDFNADEVPDGTEDYSVTLTDDPNGVRCWKSANYMVKQE